MVTISDHVMKAMGYRKYSERNTVSAKFHIAELYSIPIPLFEGKIQSAPISFKSKQGLCTALIGADPSDMLEELMNEGYDDTSQLTEDGKITQFLCVHHEIPGNFKIKGGYRQKKENIVVTYDGFPEARAYRKRWREETLPTVLVSIGLCASTSTKFFLFKKADSQFLGRTQNGTTIIDLGPITFRAEVFNTKKQTKAKVNASLRNASRSDHVLSEPLCGFAKTCESALFQTVRADSPERQIAFGDSV